jgi:fused signal recognition particle receptor
MKIPIRFIGVGESIENLREFDAEEFIDALFNTDTNAATREKSKDTT